MDDQKRDLEKNLATEIKLRQASVEKLPNDVVRITMTSQTAFDTNSASIKSGFHSTMDKLADVMVRYGKTTFTIVGDTDDVGPTATTSCSPSARALSVAEHLESKCVDSMRLATAGKGETQPRSTNNTESGRQENRRVRYLRRAGNAGLSYFMPARTSTSR